MSGGLDEVAVLAEIQGGVRLPLRPRGSRAPNSKRSLAGLECSSRSGAPAPAARNGRPACRARAAWRRPPGRPPVSCRSALRWPPAARRRGAAGEAVPPRQATMVDSTPTWVAPPSSTASMRPSRSPSTWSASVGLTRPERLAEGAATGRPACCRSAWARGWAGTRRPTLSRPARARSEIVQVGATGTTRVSGPGQNASASCRAVSSNRPCDASGFEAVEMGDQRVEARALLGGIDAARPPPHRSHRRRGRRPSRSGRPRDRRAAGWRPPGQLPPRRPADAPFGALTRDRSRLNYSLPRGFPCEICSSGICPCRAGLTAREHAST